MQLRRYDDARPIAITQSGQAGLWTIGGEYRMGNVWMDLYEPGVVPNRYLVYFLVIMMLSVVTGYVYWAAAAAEQDYWVWEDMLRDSSCCCPIEEATAFLEHDEILEPEKISLDEAYARYMIGWYFPSRRTDTPMEFDASMIGPGVFFGARDQ